MGEIKKSDLIEKIITLTVGHWEKNNEPLLLSGLGSLLTAGGFEYKELLGSESLGKFISSQSNKLKIIKHPNQSAKIGIIPSDKDFSYSEPASNDSTQKDEAFENIKRNRRAFYGFVNSLATLPPEEIESVIIPTRVLVMLLEGKK